MHTKQREKESKLRRTKWSKHVKKTYIPEVEELRRGPKTVNTLLYKVVSI